MTIGRRLDTVIESAPIVVMSALFLAPLVIFWLRVWGHDRSYRLIGSQADAAGWLPKTEASEKSHLVLMLAGIASAAYAAYVGWAMWAVVLTAGNLVTNLYPVLLQRYTRARIARVTQWNARTH
jgi:hypothetical protein